MGIVQGLTEFLPISSSGHLIIVPWLLKWPDQGLVFDSALHLGSLFAIVCYFWKDWADILKKWKQPLLWLILLGCVPAALAGLFFEDTFESVFRSPLLVGIFMISMGLLLWLAEFLGKRYRDLKDVNIYDAIFIGLAQALALMPGVSRSGITMTAGLFGGLKRETAARFSFLLSTPIIFAAGVFKLRHVIKAGLPQDQIIPFAAGVLASAIVGFFAIKYLLQFLQKHTFYVFVWYRLIVGAIIIGVWLMKV